MRRQLTDRTKLWGDDQAEEWSAVFLGLESNWLGFCLGEKKKERKREKGRQHHGNEVSFSLLSPLPKCVSLRETHDPQGPSTM